MKPPRRVPRRSLEQRQRAFRDASRHTRLVRAARKLLPLAAVGVVAAFVARSWIGELTAEVPAFAATSSLLQGSSVTMERPRLTGYSQDRRSYKVEAAEAKQDVSVPSKIGLSSLDAQMETEDNGWIRLIAKTGLFDSEAQKLGLQQSVKVTTDKGDRADLEEALVDFETSTVVSNRPVTINTGSSTLTANRMVVTENGNHVVFTGAVKLLMLPNGTATPGGGEGTAGEGAASPDTTGSAAEGAAPAGGPGHLAADDAGGDARPNVDKPHDGQGG